MANEFVRKIKKTDVTKEPLSTNTQGDIILDREKGAYIRYKDEYRKISGISNLTFNTEHVTLKNTTHDGTKRIELSEDLLDKINNSPMFKDLTTQVVKEADSPIRYMRLMKYGDIVYFQCEAKINKSWSNLGITLPQEAWPVVNTPLSAGFSATEDITVFGHAIALKSGAVNTLSLSEMSATVLLTGTWIV